MSQNAGKTILADYFDCSMSDLKNPERIQSEVLSVCPAAAPFQLIQLDSGGIHGAFQIRDIFLTIHTDPERRFAAVEISIIRNEKEFDYFKIIRRLKKTFGARNFFTMEVRRGIEFTQETPAPEAGKVPELSSRKDG